MPGLDFGVGDCDGVAAGLSEDAEDVGESRWVGNGDAAGNGAGAGSGGPGLALEGGYDGHDGLCLNHVELWEGVDSAAVLQFPESEPRAQEEGAVANGHDDMVGETVREVCGKLVGEGLCALQEVGAEVVGGVDEIVFFAESDGGLGGGFSGAGDQVQLCAVGLNLAELGLGSGVGGEDVGLDAASGGVGSDGGTGVAGRVLDYLVDAKLSGYGEHYGSASVFERAGRGGELQLGIEGVQAEGVGDGGQRDDGCVSFAKGHGGCIEDGIRVGGIGHY